MRFVSPDPLPADVGTGGNFNRYWYANNNPYKFTDKDGRKACGGDTGCSLASGDFGSTSGDLSGFKNSAGPFGCASCRGATGTSSSAVSGATANNAKSDAVGLMGAVSDGAASGQVVAGAAESGGKAASASLLAIDAGKAGQAAAAPWKGMAAGGKIAGNVAGGAVGAAEVYVGLHEGDNDMVAHGSFTLSVTGLAVLDVIQPEAGIAITIADVGIQHYQTTDRNGQTLTGYRAFGYRLGNAMDAYAKAMDAVYNKPQP